MAEGFFRGWLVCAAIHTYAEPVEARALCKLEADGMFSADELIRSVPTTRMSVSVCP
jgi:hypothetical protein